MVRREEFLEMLRDKLGSDRDELFSFVCSELMNVNPDYNWVGIYVLRDGKLVLDAFRGEKTEHNIISLGEGLCSQAIITNAIVNVPDVKGNSKYLACFPSTESELVVPVRWEGKPIGEIDIDSDRKGAFSEDDEKFLGTVADLMGKRVAEAGSA